MLIKKLSIDVKKNYLIVFLNYFMYLRILFIKRIMRKNIKTNFNYIEEFKTCKKNITEEELKVIFNKKYFEYIKRVENRTLRG